MDVLIIEDHPLFQDALSAILKNINRSVQIIRVESVEQAISIIEKKPIFDLILLDLSLPGLDGLAFIKVLNKQPVMIPVVIVSSTDDMEQINKAFEMGVMGFVPKSNDSQQIEAAINAALNGEIVKPEVLEKQSLITSDKQKKCLESLNLRKKQLQVLRLMAKGMSNNEIADELFVTNHTVKAHAAKIFRSLNCDTRVEAVLEATRLGLLDS